VCQPNDWVKDGSTSGTGVVTGARALQLEFWRAFEEFVKAKGSFLRTTKPAARHWMNISMGRAGCHLSAVISSWDREQESYDSGELRATVNLEDARTADAFFQKFHDEKEVIEQEVGQPLVWHRPEGVRARRIYLRRSAVPDARDKWPEYHEWLLRNLELLHKVFSGRVKRMPEPDAGETP
jgi:hypothetical protein